MSFCPQQTVRFPDIDNVHRLFRIGPEYQPTCPPAIQSHMLGEKRILPSLTCMLADGRYRFFAVHPRRNVREVLDSMLTISGDTIGFQLIERTDGTALVTAYYNQILGSRWLAIVDPNTLFDDRLRAKWIDALDDEETP
jgi:hypothetical protein